MNSFQTTVLVAAVLACSAASGANDIDQDDPGRPALLVKRVQIFPSAAARKYVVTAIVNGTRYEFRASDLAKPVPLPISELYEIRFEMVMEGQLSSNELPRIGASELSSMDGAGTTKVPKVGLRPRFESNGKSEVIETGYLGTYKLYDVVNGTRSAEVRAEVTYELKLVLSQ